MPLSTTPSACKTALLGFSFAARIALSRCLAAFMLDLQRIWDCLNGISVDYPGVGEMHKWPECDAKSGAAPCYVLGPGLSITGNWERMELSTCTATQCIDSRPISTFALSGIV